MNRYGNKLGIWLWGSCGQHSGRGVRHRDSTAPDDRLRRRDRGCGNYVDKGRIRPPTGLLSDDLDRNRELDVVMQLGDHVVGTGGLDVLDVQLAPIE